MSSRALTDRQTTFLEQACCSDLQLDFHSNIKVMQCEVPCTQDSLRIYFDGLRETYRRAMAAYRKYENLQLNNRTETGIILESRKE